LRGHFKEEKRGNGRKGKERERKERDGRKHPRNEFLVIRP